MGSASSKSESDGNVYEREIPVEVNPSFSSGVFAELTERFSSLGAKFSPDVVNYLADREASPETSPHRQTTLDAHIQARIQSELAALLAEEESVRHEIEQALEKENLDRERSRPEDAEGGDDPTSMLGDVKASAALLGDVDEIRRKAEKFHARHEFGDSAAASVSGEALVSCYKINMNTPLNCWREVGDFKDAVAKMEQEYLDSLR